MSLKRKDLLSLASLSVDEIALILETADSFKEVTGREIKKVPALRGKTVVNLFFEPSTRTRTSFELAAKRLGGEMKISGFREGKVPPEMVLQRLGRETVLSEALEGSLGDWYERAMLDGRSFGDRAGAQRPLPAPLPRRRPV
ncbi:MAG: hypothetical protein HC794_10060 [Nitrospiraceae bacterium]|nr:hypothetical protein [Nitrospiraceae bacterium]